MFIKYENPSTVIIVLTEVETDILKEFCKKWNTNPQELITQLYVNTAKLITKVGKCIDVFND